MRIKTMAVAFSLLLGMLVAATAAQPAAAAAPPTCNAGRWLIAGTHSQYQYFVPWYQSGGYSHNWCILREGNNNNWGVVALQNVLRRCYDQPIAVDGDFGPATKRALMNAQAWERAADGDDIAVDGIYGPETRDALEWAYYDRPASGLDDQYFCSNN